MKAMRARQKGEIRRENETKKPSRRRRCVKEGEGMKRGRKEKEAGVSRRPKIFSVIGLFR
jgi:hypothetical protein